MTVLFGTIGGLLQQQPDVPEFRPIDAQKEQSKAIKGNISAFADASKLGEKVNTFNQEQLEKMLASIAPAYKDILKKSGENIAAGLRGEVPQEVSDLVIRRSAQAGISRGFGGSQMARNLEWRDLAITGLERMDKSLDAASRWMATARAGTAPQFDVSSMFFTPQQQLAHAVSERDKQFQRNYVENQLDAAHDWRTILGQNIQLTDQQITQAAFSMAGSAAGSAI